MALGLHEGFQQLDQPAIRVVRMSDAALAKGVDRLKIAGVDVQVFNAARTSVDCFRFRNKVGLDVTLEALRNGPEGIHTRMHLIPAVDDLRIQAVRTPPHRPRPGSDAP